MRKIVFTLCSLLFAIQCLSGQDFDDKYYGKHIIIAIDQTGDVQSHNDIGIIKTWIKQLLCNEKLSSADMDPQSNYSDNFSFDENNDHISLFAFGVEGKSASYPYNSDKNVYMNIKNSQRNNSTISNKEIIEALLAQRQQYLHSDGHIADYVNDVIFPMLSNQDDKSKAIAEVGGVTLSYYVFPAILDLVDFTIPAEEYYFIIITNFKSGSSDGVNSEDEKRLGDWLTNPQVNKSFKEYISGLNNKYTRTRILTLIPGNNGANGTSASLKTSSSADAKRPQLTLYKLTPIDLLGHEERADIESNITVKQDNYGSSKYTISPIEIKLPNEDIRAIAVTISCKGKEIYHELVDKNYQNKKYTIPEIKLDCKELEEGDELSFKYVFYPNNDDNNMLPMVYVAKRNMPLTADNFAAMTAETKNFMLLMTIALIVVLAAILWFAWRWRNKRGEDTDVSIDFEILPISNTRYMDVSDNKVDNMDCWYMNAEVPDRLINVEGCLNIKYKAWAKKYNYRLEYRVEDADTDEDFTFRPDGRDANGADKVKNQWYGLPLRDDNSFDFRIVSYFDRQDRENLLEIIEQQKHIHTVVVKFRLRLVDDKRLQEKDILTADDEKSIIKTIEGPISEKAPKFEKSYTYIIRPLFERLDTWVAFDPGTTGSCVTLGAAGLPTDPSNIIVMQNRESRVGGANNYNSIFPSKIRILDRSKLFKGNKDYFDEEGYVCIDHFEEGADNDYTFGNDADNRIGRNIFQSIKKLLGYQTIIQIHNNENGENYNIRGKELAHLLVKGLYKRVEEYVLNDPNIDRQIKSYYTVDGKFCPQRAIVAVPNNYTISKIQDMVNTIKKLHKFKEVHYLYESEGVLMTFCRQEYKNLYDMQDNIFIVYDMGGATINATAFSIKVNLRGNNIDQIKVNTISKIGFCVGGDDIDYAIIKSFYSIPQINACFNNDNEITEHMLRKKQALLLFALDIKKMNGTECDVPEEFVNMVISRFSELDLPKPIERPGVETSDDDDRKEFIMNFVNGYKEGLKNNLENYVYSKVRDAVQELIAPLTQDNRKVTVIFSGRSSVYGNVKENAMSVLRDNYGQANVTDWEGFNDQNGKLDIEKVKTAVAIGANWYALFSKFVRLEHNIVPTTIGFIDMDHNASVFIPLIERNSMYENGIAKGSKTPSALLPEVEFVQMQGSDYQKILQEYYGSNGKQNRHKMNKLELVRKELIVGKINEIYAELDESNNFDYTVFSGSKITKEQNEKYALSRGCDDVKIEVADENNESYIYAITQPQDSEEDSVRHDNTTKIQSNTVRNTNRKL